MVSLHLVDSTDVDLIAALRGENLPEPGAGRYFSADHYGAVIGYVGQPAEPAPPTETIILRSSD